MSTTPNDSQPELSAISPWPPSSSAKNDSQNRMERPPFSPGLRGTRAKRSRPARLQVSSSVSTMDVDRSPSNR